MTGPSGRSVSVTGVLAEAPPAARSGMRITRKFLHEDGTPLDLDTLRQNTTFVLLLEGRAEDGQDHHALIAQGLPAGWEVVSRFNDGAVPGMAWLDKLSATDAQPAADDRYAAVVTLGPDAPGFRVAVRLRAVTPGAFELPGAEVSDMYRPAIFAHQAAAPDQRVERGVRAAVPVPNGSVNGVSASAPRRPIPPSASRDDSSRPGSARAGRNVVDP